MSAIPMSANSWLMWDGASPAAFGPLFYKPIETEGLLAPFQRLDRRVLIALDGTEHSRSRDIHRPPRATRKRSDGGKKYFHAYPGTAIVAYDHQQVRPVTAAGLGAHGRVRSKIENETFNISRTGGSNLEHNFRPKGDETRTSVGDSKVAR